MKINTPTRNYIAQHKVARLATADAGGRPSVIPVCYVFDGSSIYSALDRKPKSVSPRALKRVRNIAENKHVSLIIDDYSDDWSELSYVQVSGTAEVIDAGDDREQERLQAVEMLRAKYPNYRSMDIDRLPIIKITPTRINAWRAKKA